MPYRASRLVPLLSLLLASAAPAAECGETLSGTISAPGEVDSYTLQLAAGDVVGVTVSPGVGSTFSPLVQLLTPAGQPMLLGATTVCPAEGVCASAPAPVSGSYTLRVVANGTTGSYAVTIEALSGSWNGGSNAPPAPVCGAAADGMRTIGCGETISGAIDTLGDSDAYSFLASAGDRIGLHGDVSLELFAPGGARVGFEGGSPSCNSPCASDALPAAGVYTIRATRFVLGSYSFTLESLRESFAGGSRAQLCGTPPLACNGTRADTIDLVGDSDAFSFFAEAGDVPWLLPRLVTGPANFSPEIERFAPDGSRLPATNSPLPATGVYTIRIADGGIGSGEPADATGGYELSLVSAQLGGEICPRFPELRCGTFASGSSGGGGEYRFHSFTARAGDRASLALQKEPEEVAGAVFVIGPDGIERPANFTVTTSGTHTARLSVNGGPVSYRLSLESLSGSWNGGSNMAPTPICGDTADGTRVIGCGQTRAGAIDVAGDRDTYTFFAEAGDSVSVQVSPNGLVPSSFWVLPQLYGSNGAALAGCGFGCIVHSIPATGPYTLLISAQAAAATGSYTVTLTRTPCASDCSDGVDNDGDALVDGADGGCTSSDDLSEAPECSDGRDNDGDGAFDFSGADHGCASPLGAFEDPACDDGLDNDRDGATDADGGGTGIADASCQGVASKDAEAVASVGCGLGPELALLLPLLAAWRRRRC